MRLLSVQEIQSLCWKTLDEYIQVQGIEKVIEEYRDIRQAFYESLKTYETFGVGWTRRNQETYHKAIEMV